MNTLYVIQTTTEMFSLLFLVFIKDQTWYQQNAMDAFERYA